MKKLIACVCLLGIVCLPNLALASFFQVFFPPSAQFAAQVATASSGDGIHHSFLGVNLVNLDLFFVQMSADGTPFPPSAPWLYGRVVLVEQLGANVFRVTWNISVSSGGSSAVFVPVGQIVLTFTI